MITTGSKGDMDNRNNDRSMVRFEIEKDIDFDVTVVGSGRVHSITYI